MTDSNEDRPTYAANLDRMIRQRGLKNPWIAGCLGVTRQTVHQWRHGESTPSQPYRDTLYNILHCTEEDLSQSYCAPNLRRLMERDGVTVDGLASRLNVSPMRVQSYLNGTVMPSVAVIDGLMDVFSCTETDIVPVPFTLSLSAWAKREGIPVTRAADLFDLNIIGGCVKTPFGVLVRHDVCAPDNSKMLVAETKKWQKWGPGAKDRFIGNLHALMTIHGITNTTLATLVGVQHGTISHWRTGVRTPEDENLAKIAEVFDRTVDELMTENLPVPAAEQVPKPVRVPKPKAEKPVRVPKPRAEKPSKPVAERSELPVDPLLRGVEDLEISQRSMTVLKYNKIHDVGVLVKKTEDDLLRGQNIGSKVLREVREALASLGLSLKANQQKKPFIEPLDQTLLWRRPDSLEIEEIIDSMT